MSYILYIGFAKQKKITIIVDISGQSIPMVKGCMYIMFDMVDTAFKVFEDHSSSANFFGNRPRSKEDET